MPPFTEHSRSWRKYSERGSLLEILRLLWTEYADLHGLEVKDLPIEGLFEDGAGAPSTATEAAPAPAASGSAAVAAAPSARPCAAQPKAKAEAKAKAKGRRRS